jgi:hypothetical protein
LIEKWLSCLQLWSLRSRHLTHLARVGGLARRGVGVQSLWRPLPDRPVDVDSPAAHIQPALHFTIRHLPLAVP